MVGTQKKAKIDKKIIKKSLKEFLSTDLQTHMIDVKNNLGVIAYIGVLTTS